MEKVIERVAAKPALDTINGPWRGRRRDGRQR